MRTLRRALEQGCFVQILHVFAPGCGWKGYLCPPFDHPACGWAVAEWHILKWNHLEIMIPDYMVDGRVNFS